MSVPYLVAQNIPKPAPITPSSAAISGLSDKGRDAISAAQIAHPEYYHNNFRDAFNSFASKVSDTFEDATQPGSPPRVPIPNSGQSASSANIPAIEFINADLAKHYGMSKTTAYQEALENTSYQRAMKDMKAAGLNPAVMFGTGRAHGAGSNVYPSDAQSGGSGGYSRLSGGSSRNGKMFTASMYGAVSAIGGLIGIAATGRPDGFWIGSQVSQGAMHLMNAFNKK